MKSFCFRVIFDIWIFQKQNMVVRMALDQIYLNFYRCSLIFILIETPSVFTSVNQESQPQPRDHCEGETLQIQCALDEVILITSALYGRMRHSRCIDGPGDNLGCELDVLDILDSKCSSRQECSVHVVNVYHEIPVEFRPCGNNFRGYLQVSHMCIKVLQHKSTPNCQIQSNTDINPLYITSMVDTVRQCGSLKTPWFVQIADGQRMDITLMDFSLSTKGAMDTIAGVPTTCEVYATIKEIQTLSDSQNSHTVCELNSREQLVYSANSSRVEIRLMTSESPFLIKLEVIGCASIEPPTNGWSRRNGNQLQMGCYDSEIRWTWHCEANAWIGAQRNCSTKHSKIHTGASTANGRRLLGVHLSEHWLAIVCIIVIAFTVALCIVFAGLIYIRRRHVPLNHRHASAMPYDRTVYVDSKTQSSNVYPGEAMNDKNNSINEYLHTLNKNKIQMVQTREIPAFQPSLDNTHNSMTSSQNTHYPMTSRNANNSVTSSQNANNSVTSHNTHNSVAPSHNTQNPIMSPHRLMTRSSSATIPRAEHIYEVANFEDDGAMSANKNR